MSFKLTVVVAHRSTKHMHTKVSLKVRRGMGGRALGEMMEEREGEVEVIVSLPCMRGLLFPI